MNAAQRRETIRQILSRAKGPISASALAAQLSVSRQIVVGDVALLRAGGFAVDATPRGYVAAVSAEKGYVGLVACTHSTPEQLRQELESGKFDNALRNMNGADAQKFQQAIRNPQIVEKLMSAPQAKALYEKLTGGKQ